MKVIKYLMINYKNMKTYKLKEKEKILSFAREQFNN